MTLPEDEPTNRGLPDYSKDDPTISSDDSDDDEILKETSKMHKFPPDDSVPVRFETVNNNNVSTSNTDDFTIEAISMANDIADDFASNMSSLSLYETHRLTEQEAVKLVYDLSYGDAKKRFKSDYPFYAEGVVMLSAKFRGMIEIYTTRVGKIEVEDHTERKNYDYVYFLVEEPGIYSGMCFYKCPPSIISSKNYKNESIEVRGYAILAKGSAINGEGTWKAWNDSCGLMRVHSGAARTSIRKYDEWEVTLDVIRFIAIYNNQSYSVSKIDYLTQRDMGNKVPEYACLVENCRLLKEDKSSYMMKCQRHRLLFHVPSSYGALNWDVEYMAVIVPYFLSPQHMEWQALFVGEPIEFERNKNFREFRQNFKQNTEKLFEIPKSKNLVLCPIPEGSAINQSMDSTTSSSSSKFTLPPRCK